MERVTYSKDGKTAYFDGHKFRRDSKTGYYLAGKPTYQGKRERLHCYVWRYFNGPIPDGFHIHHKDENKDHNDIENLACVPVSEHTSYHSRKYISEHHEEVVENLDRARAYASEWHRSQEGRAWHIEHGKKTFETMQKREYTCRQCGEKYLALPVGPVHKYCSNACKTAARVKSGVDNERRFCAACGKEFTANKYTKTKCCSRSCAARLRASQSRKKRRPGTDLQHGSGRLPQLLGE